tara:strand:- start:78 stop:275 length:198 start_codon:yes stop_codon:yes gene_type:complete
VPFCFGIVKTEKQIQSEYGTDLPRFVKEGWIYSAVFHYLPIYFYQRELWISIRESQLGALANRKN